ncbi:hypothetical protein ACO1LU_14600, partial [Staphylococcus aureus]
VFAPVEQLAEAQMRKCQTYHADSGKLQQQVENHMHITITSTKGVNFECEFVFNPASLTQSSHSFCDIKCMQPGP